MKLDDIKKKKTEIGLKYAMLARLEDELEHRKKEIEEKIEYLSLVDIIISIVKERHIIEEAEARKKMKESDDLSLDEIRIISVEDLGLSTRACRSLMYAKVKTLDDVIKLIERKQLKTIKNIGDKTQEEIVQRISYLTGVDYSPYL